MANKSVFETLNVVDRLTSTELVQDAITRAIVRGQIRPGDSLVETDLANRLGVSRGPVREALAQLERMGLVEKIPYKGSFVSNLTQEDVNELYTVRTRLEGLAARRIAEGEGGDREESIAMLESILDEMRAASREQDNATLVELDLRFHRALCVLSKHKLLMQIWENHLEISLKRFLFLKQERLYTNPSEAVDIHQPIVDAIRSGDADEAEAAATHHVIEAGKRSSVER